MLKRSLTGLLTRQRPLILLGARRVGKTTLVKEFASRFSNFVHLDLETIADRQIFTGDQQDSGVLKAIAFLKGKDLKGRGTLLVLDEIGACPEAALWMKRVVRGEQGNRGAGEHAGGWTGGQVDGWTVPFILATSSYINEVIKELMVDPAAGILHVMLHPFSFGEFLDVLGDQAAREAYREVPVPEYAYLRLLDYFNLYALIGGMPEIVAGYAEHQHIGRLKPIYESIGSRWETGLAGPAPGKKSHALAVDVLQNAYPFAATRISYNHFSNMEKGSREISQAFALLEQAFLLKRMWPVTSAGVLSTPETDRNPRLYLADTGMVNYFSGIQKPLFRSHDMNTIFAGQIARQSVGQELLATASANHLAPGASVHPDFPLQFWVRNKNQSSAEVDFILHSHDLAIPVMVRAGEPGRLRALHMFMEEAPHPFAIRLYADKLQVMQTSTLRGRKFFLLNLPYFLAGKIGEYMAGFMRLAEGK